SQSAPGGTGGTTLGSSIYGFWAISDSSTGGRVGVFATGNETPAGSVPILGTATYNGSTLGVASSAGAEFALTGTAQLVAHFAAATVTTTLSNLQTENVSTGATGTLTSLTGIQTIAGNRYTGPLAGGSLSGTLNGTFYGTNAAETAGVWNAAGGGVN